MDGKSSSSSSSDQSTPRTKNLEELQDLVKLLDQNSKRSLPKVSGFMNLLQKTPAFGGGNLAHQCDWVDMHDKLLLIPSNYFSRMLGGAHQQSKSDRMTGLARLDMICARARPEGKLVLEFPAYDDTIDVSELERLPIMRAKILSSEQNRTTSGDNTGFEVRQLLSISRDQIYFMYLNAACVPVRNRHPDYERLNTSHRNAYQGAFNILVHGVFSFTEEAELMQKCVEAAIKPDSQQCLHDYDNRRFQDLPLYTVIALQKYFYSMIGIDNAIIHFIDSFTTTLEVMVKYLIPELSKVEGQTIDLAPMEEFISRVYEWWNHSPFLPIRETRYTPLPSDTKKYLTHCDSTVLCRLIKEPLTVLKKIIAEIRVLRTLHPYDKNQSETMTPIHEFSFYLLQHSERLLSEVQDIVQFMGEVDDQQLCSDRTSFLYVYGELRRRYISMYGVNVGVKLKSNGQVSKVPDTPALQPAEADGHNGAGFFSSSHRATPSPPTSRLTRGSQNGVGNESGGKAVSPYHSPRAELTSSTSGQLQKTSPRQELSSSIPGAAPRSPRLESRKSGNPVVDPNQSTKSTISRTPSGKLPQGGETVSTSVTGSHSGSTRISPAGSARQSPSGSARNSPREREQQRSLDQAGAPDLTGSKYTGNGSRSLRRKSFAKSTANAQLVQPLVDPGTYSPAEYVKK